MKKFVLNTSIFLFPLLLLVACFIWSDVFKVFGYQDYSSDQKIGINRGMVTTTSFNHFRGKEKFNSFIFGSSRSQAYKCKEWVNYLDKSSKPFHFDGSGEGLWDVCKKVQYIDNIGDTIKNALIVVDREMLGVTYPREGHLFIAMPCLSKLSKIKYYLVFFKAFINLLHLI